MKLLPAPEPSDIIWENQSSDDSINLRKKILIYGIIIMILMFSCSIVYLLQKKLLRLKQKYPPTTCASVDALYTNQAGQWQEDSIKEY